MTQLAVRLDRQARAALEELVRRSGRSQSQLVRDAVIAYERQDLLARMRAESEAIRDDPAEQAESDQLLSELRDRRAW